MYFTITTDLEASGNEEDQQYVNGAEDCIWAVIGDNTKIEDMPTDSKSESEDDVIHVQQVQRVQEPMGWSNIMWRWAKSLFV